MSQADAETAAQQIDRRITALSTIEKQLKRPSNISFGQRRELSGKAVRAIASLKEQQSAHPEAALDAEGNFPEPLKLALEEADKVLGVIAAARPSDAGTRSNSGSKSIGQQRGAAGASQTRPPDRVGE